MRVNGQNNNEGVAIVAEERLDRVQNQKHFVLFATVEPIDDHDQSTLLRREAVQALDLRQNTHF